LAEKIMEMEDLKAMKRAVQKRGIPNFSQSILDRHLYGIVEALPYDVVWGCGCREHEPTAQQRETWKGLNLLGEILTEVKDELMAERRQSDEGDVLAVGLSIEPVTDFGELQRSCPEASIFID